MKSGSCPDPVPSVSPAGRGWASRDGMAGRDSRSLGGRANPRRRETPLLIYYCQTCQKTDTLLTIFRGTPPKR